MAQVKFLSGPKANLDTLKNSDGGKLTVGALYFCEDVQRLYRAIKEDEYIAVDEQFVIALEEPTVDNTVEGKIYLYNLVNKYNSNIAKSFRECYKESTYKDIKYYIYYVCSISGFIWNVMLLIKKMLEKKWKIAL